MKKPLIALTALVIALSACQSQKPMPIPPNVSFDRCNFLPFAGERFFSFDGKTQMSIDIRQNGKLATVKDGQTILAQGVYDDFDKRVAIIQDGKPIGYYGVVFEDENGQRHSGGLLQKLKADGKTPATGCDPSNPDALCRAKLYGGNAVPACQEWRLTQ